MTESTISVSPFSDEVQSLKDLASARKQITDRIVSLAGFGDRSQVRIPWGALVLQRLYVDGDGEHWASITDESSEQKTRIKGSPDAIFRIAISPDIQRWFTRTKDILWED